MYDQFGGWADEQSHLTNWLAEYDGPGYYKRAGHNYDARHFYTRFQDGYGLMWLAEALGVERSALEEGVRLMKEKLDARPGSRAAAFRKACPWPLIEEKIQAKLSQS